MKNFFSVGNNFIEIDLNNHKKTLVVGANGGSKTSCTIDSIVFALYGKPFRKTNKPNIINSINKSELVVELEFSIGSKEYKIIRGLKPNIFEIYCNGKLINQEANSKDYQEYLEKYILKINYKSFTNVVILGSARYNPFMKMSAGDRRAIIEELLDIQIFSTMNVLVKDKISKLKEQEMQVNYNIDLSEEKIKLQKKNIKEQQKNNKEQIEEKQREINNSNRQVEQLHRDVELIQKHIDVLQTKVKEEVSFQSRKQKLLSIEGKIESNINKLKKENEFYTKNDNCPTCKQHIETDFKSQQISYNSDKKDELEKGLLKLETELTSIQEKLKVINGINKKIIDHQSEIVRINASINAIQNFTQKILKEISNLNDKHSIIENSDNHFNELLKSLEEYKIEKDKISEEKKYYDFSANLLKDGGIKTRIIKQYLPILNKLINTYLSKLNFFVNFNINENFEEIIKSRHRDEFKYENFSEGEKLRIDLSILFAFRQIAKMKNSVNTNLFLMDEILDSSLDADGIDLFLDLISNLDDKTNIIIISHKHDQMFDKFDRVLKFEKKKNFTKMIQVV